MVTTSRRAPSSDPLRPWADPRTVLPHHDRHAGALWRALVSRVGVPAAQGVGLLLATGSIVLVTSPLHVVDQADWQLVWRLSGAMTALVLLCALLPWRRWPAHTRLLFPVAALVPVWLLSALGGGLGAAYVGVFVLAFVYVGLHLPRHSCWLLLPVGVALYGPALGGWTREHALRAAVFGLVWVLVAEVLATLCERNREALAAVQEASRTDLLTRLDNRRALQDHLGDAPPGTVFALCDLDHFKVVNDTRGHAAGDRVLAEFARVLRLAVRDRDHAVRYGGEEFLLVLHADASTVPGLLLRLHQAWSLSCADTTFSCGWAVHTSARSPEATLAAADAALYAAKQGGRGRDATEPVAALATSGG